MDITTGTEGDLVQFHVAGSIDASTSPNVEEAVNAAIVAGSRKLIFDMRGVNYISSAGLRALLMAAKKAKAAGGGAAVYGVQAGVEEVFTVAGFGRIVPVVSTDAEARAKLAAQ